MNNLFLEIEILTNENETTIWTSVDSFVVFYVYKYLNSNIKLNLVRTTFPMEKAKLMIKSTSLYHELTEQNIICKNGTKNQVIKDLKLPAIVKNGNVKISGVCAVSREIICSGDNVEQKKLLGFKESCLLAPSETSIWTRFCEVNVIAALDSLLTSENTEQEYLPDAIVHFENHMKQPVRMHNIYKLARENAKNNKKKGEEKVIIDCKTPKELLEINHRFAEGINLTIADLILYPCFKIIFDFFKISDYFPFINAWISEIENFYAQAKEVLSSIIFFSKEYTKKPIYKVPVCNSISLYKSDPRRYKPRNRIFTEQTEVNAALEKLESLNLKFSSISKIIYDSPVDWDSIETENNSNNCHIPVNRAERKRQQLGNLANAVFSIAKDGDKIIDFCSGTGHLGILLALKLPRCTVIFLENKPISLQRAIKRATDLKLKNCLFYQCNIDYFVGEFNIGTSLHACGTATDIVLKKCIRSRANFVCCPCCYGSIQPMPHISYPLSEKFRSVLTEKEFLHIAHAADQAHEIGTINCKPEICFQGKLCMDIIDSDRKLHAEEAGYRVILTRLTPENCTPKNRLLVGCIDLKEII